MDTSSIQFSAPPQDEIGSSGRSDFATGAEQDRDDDYNPADAYRALSTAAVASLVLGVMSIVAFLDWWLALIPIVGITLGIVGLRKIRRQPQEYTGRGVAIAGMLLGLLFWFGGFGRLAYIRATEVPPGYERVDYSQLQPQPDDPPNSIPPEAKALGRQKDFHQRICLPRAAQGRHYAVFAGARSRNLLFWWKSKNYGSHSSGTIRCAWTHVFQLAV